MPPASASSVRTAEAIKARPWSLVWRLLLKGFGMSDKWTGGDFRP